MQKKCKKSNEYNTWNECNYRYKSVIRCYFQYTLKNDILYGKELHFSLLEQGTVDLFKQILNLVLVSQPLEQLTYNFKKKKKWNERKAFIKIWDPVIMFLALSFCPLPFSYCERCISLFFLLFQV